MSWAMMRRRLPDFLTLPSKIDLTFKACPISLTFAFLPLKEKEEVRAATFRSLIFANALRSSSARPSQKYSFSGSALMLAKGNTAIDAVCGSVCVLNSPLNGDEGRFRVSEEYRASECAISRAPSARQKASASSVSTRLHWGHRFIICVVHYQPMLVWQLLIPSISRRPLSDTLALAKSASKSQPRRQSVW